MVQEPPATPKRGAPTTYTPEIAVEFCERLEAGEPIREICKAFGTSWSTIQGWRRRHPDFAAQYARAREASAESFELQALEEAGKATDGESAHVARLRVDTLKWAAAKRHPRQYSDRIQQDLSGQVTLSQLVTAAVNKPSE